MNVTAQFEKVESGVIVLADGTRVEASLVAVWLRQIAARVQQESGLDYDLCWGAGALEKIAGDRLTLPQ